MNIGFNEFTLADLEKMGGQDTSSEIASQPRLWKETYKLIYKQREKILCFLDEIYAMADLNIILTGAGSSAFIGEILEGPFQKNTGKFVKAVATTDIVTHPENYLRSKTPTLLISFARSGNSPESLAAVEISSLYCEKIFHLIITCNEKGELINSSELQENVLPIVLPGETNDKGLAMTSSFTSMLLAGLLISRMKDLEVLEPQIELLAQYAEKLLTDYMPVLKSVAQLDFTRVVFLGSGPLQGAAKESHLKLQELNDGKIICKHDSFLGFRHGPRVVINDSTLIVYLFSNNEYVHKYEKDLIDQVDKNGLYRLGIIESSNEDLNVDKMIELSGSGTPLSEEFLSVCFVLPAQIIGFYKSMSLGFKPDSPSASGAISRVVEGVKIYPYDDMKNKADIECSN